MVFAAAAAWAFVGVAAFAFPSPRAPRPIVQAIPSHRTSEATGLAWTGADRVYEEVDRRARGLGRDERTRVARVILEEAARADLAPALVLAVIQVESGFDARAVSPAGALGLMQLMMPTLREELSRARLAHLDPFDPAANVRAGVRYLARLVSAFGEVELALMAYNAGPNRIRRHLADGGVPVRLLVYPREVLRRESRLAPPPPEAGPASRVALASAPARRPALARAHGPRTGAVARSGAVATIRRTGAAPSPRDGAPAAPLAVLGARTPGTRSDLPPAPAPSPSREARATRPPAVAVASGRARSRALARPSPG